MNHRLLPLALLPLLLTACVSGPHLSASERSALLATDDVLIVPGERIGPVFLDMTETELQQKLGAPPLKVDGAKGQVNEAWVGVNAMVDTASHRVVAVTATGDRYYTANGLTIGSPDMQLMATMGPPRKAKVANGESRYCFGNGLEVYTRDGRVTAISVRYKACD